MKKHLAHTLRRTARRMIRWSNRLDKPHLGTAADRAGEQVAAITAQTIRLAEARRRAARR